MAHPNRARRKANEERRTCAAHKQRPVPAEVQEEVAARRKAERAARYPVAPVYEDAWCRKPRAQPACYDLPDIAGVSAFNLFLGRLMREAQSRRRRQAMRPAA